MIIKLLPEQISEYWNVIRHGTLQVNPQIPPEKVGEFCRNLLKNLLADRYQCWFALDENKIVKAMSITRIFRDAGELPYLLIDTVYGFSPTTVEQKKEYFEALVLFAKNIGCSSIITWTNNPMASNAAMKAGFQHTHNLLTYFVK